MFILGLSIHALFFWNGMLDQLLQTANARKNATYYPPSENDMSKWGFGSNNNTPIYKDAAFDGAIVKVGLPTWVVFFQRDKKGKTAG